MLSNLGPLAQLRAGRLPRRLAQLVIGLALYGASMAAFIRAGLGMIPWDVLHYGVSLHVPLDLGTVVIAVSLLTLLLWIPLRQAPGLGTIANALLIGLFLNATMALLPAAHAWPWQIGLMALGVLGNGLATAMYIGAQLGPGPRDGLMTGLAARMGLSIRVVRTAIEITVVALGWLLGGVFGVATVLYALAIGPITQWLLPPFVVRLPDAPQPRG